MLNDDSAFLITAFLDYARDRDDIKAVMIKLNSPGGGAAASEQVYMETCKLREEKPVVIVMDDLVASGAFMMSMGANYTYAKGATFVGHVGVRLTNPGPLVPSTPDEGVITTGPFKNSAGSRRHFIQLADQLGEGFVQLVLAERGDKLRISREDLLQALIYSGIDAKRFGLVDDIGGETEAIEKAAELANISDYELVDINIEVFRRLNQNLARILEPLFDLGGNQMDLADVIALMGAPQGAGTGDSVLVTGSVTGMDILRRFFLPPTERENNTGIDIPRIDYLYDGSAK